MRDERKVQFTAEFEGPRKARGWQAAKCDTIVLAVARKQPWSLPRFELSWIRYVCLCLVLPQLSQAIIPGLIRRAVYITIISVIVPISALLRH